MLFQGVTGQFIDDSGKARMLTYDGLTLMVSPIPPLTVPENKKINRVTLGTALAFIKEKKLKIVSQDGDATGIVGVRVETDEENPSIYYGYIPLADGTKPIANVDFGDSIDPLSTSRGSKLAGFKYVRKIALYLKHYVLYTYARSPDSFDAERDITVEEDYIYDVDSLHKRLFFDGNNVMYSSGKLIAPSEDAKKRLISYLKVKLLNDGPGVLAQADMATIPDYYETIDDFRHIPNQLVFGDKSSLKRWKKEKEMVQRNPHVLPKPDPKTQEPYFYRSPRIRRNDLMIVQNVEGGDLATAKYVCIEWITGGARVNVGFNPDIQESFDAEAYPHTA